MNVLVLTGLFPPNIGGAATYFAMLLRHLSKERDIEKIVVLAEWIPNRQIIDQKGRQTVVWRCLPQRDSNAVRVSFDKLAMFLATHLLLTFLVPFLVLRYRIDIIHAHSRLARRYLWLIARVFGAACIFDLRDKMFRASNVRKSDMLICASRAVYEEAVRKGLGPERMTQIPIPFEPLTSPDNGDALMSAYSLTKPYLCFVGSISPNKGIYELIDAFQEFREANNNYSLIIAGVNREGAGLFERIGNRRGVRYLGELNTSQVAVLIQNSELVVLPSKSEGMPRVCLEAISLSKKVICPPNIPEFNEACPEFVLNEVTVANLRDKIEETLKSGEVPSYPLGKHDPSAVSAQVSAIYRKCLVQG